MIVHRNDQDDADENVLHLEGDIAKRHAVAQKADDQHAQQRAENGTRAAVDQEPPSTAMVTASSSRPAPAFSRALDTRATMITAASPLSSPDRA